MSAGKPRRPGRPKAAEPLNKQKNVRLTERLDRAIARYRERYEIKFNLREDSDAVRHMLYRVLEEEGLLADDGEGEE